MAVTYAASGQDASVGHRRTRRLGHAKSNTSCKLVINLKKTARRAFCLNGDAIGHYAYHAEKAEAFEALAKLVRDITKAAL
jgi:hypothetical protein